MVFPCCNFRIKRCFLSEKLKPLNNDKEEKEDVYPIHSLDQPSTRQSMRTWVLCFNDVLNAPKLHDALCSLLERGDWKKLGARLRVRNDGLFEAYVPKVYSPEEPACTFLFDEHYDSQIEHHPAGKSFSSPCQRAFTQTYPANCQLGLMHPSSPMTVQDIIDRKLPQLTLHILAFSNATIVTISTPASMMDHASFKSLLENWSLVLAGRQDGAAPVFGPRNDVLEELVRKAEAKHAVERGGMPSKGSLRYRICEWWRRRKYPLIQRRMVYIPKVIYDELLGQIRRDMERILEDEEQRPIVSDAEILFAWMCKLQGGDGIKARAVAARNMFNLRQRLSSLRDPSGEYLQTLTFPLCSRLSAEDARESVGHIALGHKRNMDKLTSEYQLLSLTKSFLEMRKRGKDPFIQRKADAGGTRSLDYCNMTSLHLLSAADFEPAVLQCGDPDMTRCNALGTMTTAYALEMGKKPMEAECQVIGKDSEGHLWMYCQLEPDVWVRLEEELYRLQKVINSPVSGNSVRQLL